MIKTVVKLYLFIENKELSFNIGLKFLLWHIEEIFSIASLQFLICLNLLLNLPSWALCNRFVAKENFKPN